MDQAPRSRLWWLKTRRLCGVAAGERDFSILTENGHQILIEQQNNESLRTETDS